MLRFTLLGALVLGSLGCGPEPMRRPNGGTVDIHYDEFYIQGRRAKQAGEPLQANPYHDWGRAAYWWTEGWLDG